MRTSPSAATPTAAEAKGDADLAAVGSLLADPGRCRMLLALDDGRALPATTLAGEAGVSTSTASGHLAKLLDAGLLSVERHGRHRYYRLAGPTVGALIEAVVAVAPPAPIRSLRQGTRARALREARTCYDHLAGRLGVQVMTGLLERGHLTGGDGRHRSGGRDRLSAPGEEVDYRITAVGQDFLDGLGVTVPPRRRVVRYCVDWTEQRHHLGGGLGRGLLDRFTELGWVRRAERDRAVRVTDTGRAELALRLGVDLADPAGTGARR